MSINQTVRSVSLRGGDGCIRNRSLSPLRSMCSFRMNGSPPIAIECQVDDDDVHHDYSSSVIVSRVSSYQPQQQVRPHRKFTRYEISPTPPRSRTISFGSPNNVIEHYNWSNSIL